MKYILIQANTTRELVLQVQQSLDQGYKCQGGIAVTTDSRLCLFIQAMIKE